MVVADEAKKVNFRGGGSGTTDISPSEVPTLIPEKAKKEFMEGDADPYFKIQEIEYPIKANGYIYTESFFESFVEKTKIRPTPGSKSGHSLRWGERPPTDFILVGGKLVKNGNGTGKVYFKNYIPPKLVSDNEAFKKEARADMVHFSLVTYSKDEIVESPDGDREYYVIQSLYGERNDAVEFDTGGMDQKTNKAETGITPDEAYKNNTGEKPMDELLKKLLTYKANGELNVSEFAKKLGIEVKTDEDKKNASLVTRYQNAVGTPENAEQILADKKANSGKVMGAKIVELFGTKEINGKKNRAHAYATKVLKDAVEANDEVKFNAVIEELKTDEFMTEFKAAHVNPLSEENRIEGVSLTGNTQTEEAEVYG